MDARGPRLAPLTCGDTVILPRLVHERNARIALGILLITQRSQVQILPPLQVKSQVRGPFDREIERAFGFDVGRMWAGAVGGRPRTAADRDGRSFPPAPRAAARHQSNGTPIRFGQSLHLPLPAGWLWSDAWTELLNQACGPPAIATT